MKPSSTTRLLICMAMLVCRLQCNGHEEFPLLQILHRQFSSVSYICPPRGKGVVVWGRGDLASVPREAHDAIAVSARAYHSAALRRDGSIVDWGVLSEYWRVPAVSGPFVAVAAGAKHTLGLRADGTVAAWGGYTFEIDNGVTNVPTNLKDAKTIAAGLAHSVALRRNGTVVAWGANDSGQTRLNGATNVSVVGASYDVTDSWGTTGKLWLANDQTGIDFSVPSNIVAVARNTGSRYLLNKEGMLLIESRYGGTGWIFDAANPIVKIDAEFERSFGMVTADGMASASGNIGQGGVTEASDVAVGYNHAVAIGRHVADFGRVTLGETGHSWFKASNIGSKELSELRFVFDGDGATAFRVVSEPQLPHLSPSEDTWFVIGFSPRKLGSDAVTLKIYSNDPDSPFVLPLKGTGTFELTATKSNIANSPFTYAPLRLDRQTGLMVQKITFTNTTGVLLDGLRLILSKVASGVQVYSSSAGKTPGALEVVYSNAIKANETISFDLVYFDPKRRTAETMNPVIRAEALLEPEQDSLPVAGTVVPLLSARTTPQGPFLEWNSAAGKTYVVEYSDDVGKSWLSAVHRLSTGSTRMMWVDRGQPETKTKPTGTPNKAGGRSYRVKKI